MENTRVRVLSVLLILGVLIGVLGCAAPASTPTTSTPTLTTPTLTTPTPTLTTPKPSPTPTPTPTTPAITGVFKFASLGPLSGAAAAWGIAQSRGVRWAADEVNKAGGLLVDGKRYNIQVIDYDTEYKTDKAVDSVNRAIFFDGSKYFINVGGACVQACQPIAERNGVLQMGNTTANKTICRPDAPLTFIMIIMSTAYGPTVYYPELVKEFGVKRLAVMNPDDATGYMCIGVIKDVIKQRQIPLELVSEQYYARGAQDFTPMILRVLAAKPDIIDLPSVSDGDAGLLLKQLGEAGYTGLHLTSNSVATPSILYQIAGKYAVGHFCMGQSATPPTPEFGAFQQEYVKRFNESMNPVAPYTYEEIKYLFQAIEKANTFDTMKVAYIYEGMEWDGLYGHFRWGGTEPVFGFGIKRTPVALYPMGRIGPDGKIQDWKTLSLK